MKKLSQGIALNSCYALYFTHSDIMNFTFSKFIDYCEVSKTVIKVWDLWFSKALFKNLNKIKLF